MSSRTLVTGADRGQRAARTAKSVAFYALLALILVPFLFVLFWMALNSFKTERQITAYPPLLLFEPTLRNFEISFERNQILRFAQNSLIVASGATLLGLVFGVPAAYAIARFKLQRLGLAILVARVMPGISFLIPLFLLFRSLELVDTLAALILTHLIITLPIIVWMMISYFEDVPYELEESARVDGCNQWSAFVRIALPLVRPGLAAASILSFIFSWNNFLFALALSGFRTKTLPVAVLNNISYEGIRWGELNATATLITLPVILLALLVQRQIVRGLTSGAVKG